MISGTTHDVLHQFGSTGINLPVLTRQVAGEEKIKNKPQSIPASRNPPAQSRGSRRCKAPRARLNMATGKFERIKRTKNKVFEQFTVGELREFVETSSHSESEDVNKTIPPGGEPPGLARHPDVVCHSSSTAISMCSTMRVFSSKES